jgi:hypothetical protein
MSNVLDAATIQELLSKQKSRGDYDAELRAFLEQGVAGIEISLTEGRFAGKKAGQVKTGLDNARKRTNDAGALVHDGGQNVKVIALGDAEKGEEEHVYLINTAVTAESATEAE